MMQRFKKEIGIRRVDSVRDVKGCLMNHENSMWNVIDRAVIE
eukprot:CAMPEP_0182442484 /NCGR_PEP_ID=MMETSP1172-20130603/1392_1 /TAXON_ID=708627 /ORGANISM="Timspurckia oligopyrenoides, Strain CCMP3278" /LENGTH=41 /DNA_ID= /DNA_START= /DNA_END= /DNA_ORIENTATION=